MFLHHFRLIAAWFTQARPLALLAMLSAALALGGCNEFSGTFASEEGHTIEFTGDFAYITIVPAPAIEATYTQQRNTIVLRTPGDQIVLTRIGDRLEAAMLGMTFARQ